jgi:hypothetical protein
MGLVGFLYDKMETYNITLYGSDRFLVWQDGGFTTQRCMGRVSLLYDKMGTYNIALYGSGAPVDYTCYHPSYLDDTGWVSTYVSRFFFTIVLSVFLRLWLLISLWYLQTFLSCEKKSIMQYFHCLQSNLFTVFQHKIVHKMLSSNSQKYECYLVLNSIITII